MRFKEYLIFFITLVFSSQYSHGCTMEGVNWFFPQALSIKDIDRGQFFNASTTGISGIQNIAYNVQLNRGPYFDIVLSDSLFSISTSSSFEDYEEYETETSLSITVVFQCPGFTPSQQTLVFMLTIVDTNNNDPVFRPTGQFEITLIPPLPPGYQVTACLYDIIARDIDLTTQRVDFEIFDTTYFQIAYDSEATSAVKEFKAKLETTTFIRSIPEPIVFRISATDVDLTGDPPRTTNATVIIRSDGEFDLPDEPVFSRAFYLATYTEANQVVLQEPISLRQGYHEDVLFSLGEEYSQYFTLSRSLGANQISIQVISSLSNELLELDQLLLVVTAERNNTSGATTTVILRLPEDEALKFQQPSYEGSIVDNILNVPELVLTQGYLGIPPSVEIIAEHATYFRYTTVQNVITLAMNPLPSNIIEQNSFLNLQVVASVNNNNATTIVTLEIIKDDGVTPVFERALYEGTYDPDNGLEVDQIVMVQGYDDSVQVVLQGEHSDLFQIVPNGPTFNLTVSSLPPALFNEGNLLLTFVATKPRTVGANTVISIALPPEIQLEFEQENYKGVIEDNILKLTELILSQGYHIGPVSVHIQNGSVSSYFSADIQNNRITVSMSPLPAEVIQLNTFVSLQVVASTAWSTTFTILTLEIIKNDYITPVFDRALYEGAYDPENVGLQFDEMILEQGYDETVDFFLRGGKKSITTDLNAVIATYP